MWLDLLLDIHVGWLQAAKVNDCYCYTYYIFWLWHGNVDIFRKEYHFVNE